MASFKEQIHSRPLSQSRIPTSSTSSLNVPNRHGNPRNHAHSVSLGTFNPTHRVTRRKSMTSNAANAAAIAAVIQGFDEASLEATGVSDHRGATARAGKDLSAVRVPAATPGPYSGPMYREVGNTTSQKAIDLESESAIQDGSMLPAQSSHLSKPRNRRASEGAYLTKSDGKRASGELRCDKCGKGYKHSSCLTKHLWEHTPEWSYTSKLLISKHQQVQLLEAASVLVTMNQDASASAEPTKVSDGEYSSASPEASGFSELQDDDSSSVETTPPPLSEQADFPARSDVQDTKRYSNTSSVFSRSYQSAPSGSVAGSSFPTTASYGSFYHSGYQRRLSTSGAASNGHEDEADLAAAVELCHFGTPRTGPVQMDDIPPVPPLPARYRAVGGAAFPLYHQELGIPPPLTHRLSDERDVKMHDMDNVRHADDNEEYDDLRSVSRGHSDEDDDGVFGRMEE